MNNFERFGLSKNLNQTILDMDFQDPTPIQSQAIPIALEGRDILGSAQTGTGKTAAFCIPMIELLTRNTNMAALVMTPTRELARQILDVVNQLVGKKNTIRSACLIGGEAIGKQLSQLRKGPRIIIGTPGRINDHLERETLDLMDCGYLVLDETDRMLDMGFGIQIDQTLQYLPPEKQTLLFSATLPAKIMKLSKKYLYNPIRITVDPKKVLLTNIKHEIINIEHNKKYNELLIQLSKRNGSILIFAKTKYGTQRMAKNLTKDGYKADALNGNLNQTKRDKIMNNFRQKKFKVLVATDIASRGLDVEHIQHVINYDLPQVAEDYIHRIGRTGRAGSNGSAICFISPEEKAQWDEINYLLNPETIKRPSPATKKPRSSRKKKTAVSDNVERPIRKSHRSFSKKSDPRRSSKSNTDSRTRRSSKGKAVARPTRNSETKKNIKGNKSSRVRNRSTNRRSKTLSLKQRSRR